MGGGWNKKKGVVTSRKHKGKFWSYIMYRLPSSYSRKVSNKGFRRKWSVAAASKFETQPQLSLICMISRDQYKVLMLL